MEEKVLAPSITREIDFYGDRLLTVLVGDTPYVAIRPITDFLGIDWSSQRQRIQRDEVLVEKARLVAVIGADQKRREMFCLPIEFLPGWLFGIDTSRVRSELKEKLIRYRRECFHILWQAFQSESLTSLSAESSPLEQIRATALAVAQLAEQQIQMEQREQHLTKRLDKAIALLQAAPIAVSRPDRQECQEN